MTPAKGMACMVAEYFFSGMVPEVAEKEKFETMDVTCIWFIFGLWMLKKIANPKVILHFRWRSPRSLLP